MKECGIFKHESLPGDSRMNIKKQKAHVDEDERALLWRKAEMASSCSTGAPLRNAGRGEAELKRN